MVTSRVFISAVAVPSRCVSFKLGVFGCEIATTATIEGSHMTFFGFPKNHHEFYLVFVPFRGKLPNSDYRIGFDTIGLPNDSAVLVCVHSER